MDVSFVDRTADLNVGGGSGYHMIPFKVFVSFVLHMYITIAFGISCDFSCHFLSVSSTDINFAFSIVISSSSRDRNHLHP